MICQFVFEHHAEPREADAARNEVGGAGCGEYTHDAEELGEQKRQWRVYEDGARHRHEHGGHRLAGECFRAIDSRVWL